MLCLSRTAGVWSNEIVPTLVARTTQERLRPVVALIAKKMKWRPVVIFGAVGAAHLALVTRPSRLNFPRFYTSGQDNLLGNEVRGAIPAAAHIEVLDRTALVLALYDLPRLMPTALWARVVGPFKRLCNHQTVPVLR